MSVNRSDARRTISRRKSADCAYVTPRERRREISLANPRDQGVLKSSLEPSAEVEPPAFCGSWGTHVPGTIPFFASGLFGGLVDLTTERIRRRGLRPGEAYDVARGRRGRARDVFAVAFERRPGERARAKRCARDGDAGRPVKTRRAERFLRPTPRAPSATGPVSQQGRRKIPAVF
jgi:hypothetical protein